MSPAAGSLHGGQAITVRGSGFGSAADKLSVYIDGAECAVTGATSSSVSCVTPPKHNASEFSSLASRETAEDSWAVGVRVYVTDVQRKLAATNAVPTAGGTPRGGTCADAAHDPLLEAALIEVASVGGQAAAPGFTTTPPHWAGVSETDRRKIDPAAHP